MYVDPTFMPPTRKAKESNKDKILSDGSNKLQALIKLEIARDNLEGVDEALSDFDRPRVEKALLMINEVLSELKKERKRGF